MKRFKTPLAAIVVALEIAVAAVFFAGSAGAADLNGAQQIKTDGISISVDATGNIVSARVKGRDWPLTGGTSLVGCNTVGQTKLKKSGRTISFVRSVTDSQGHQAIVTDRFTPTRDSIRWEVEIKSESSPWSTAIQTSLNYPATEKTRFWTAWSDPEHRNDGWRDPLVLHSLTNTTWPYSNLTGGGPEKGDYICLPLLTLAEPDNDCGVSLVLSPEDLNLDLRLKTTAGGAIQFSRSKLRLGNGKTVRLAMDLTAHEADWRGGLRWLVARYPLFFNPPNPHVDEMAGCGAYSGDENPIDVAKFKQMAFRINWKLSDDFPYMGMFIPPVTNVDERWQRSGDEKAPANKPATTSCRQLNDYAHYMRTNGFYVLNYFNVTEFGKNMAKPAVRKAGDPELWKDPRAFLEDQLPGAILIPGAATCYNASVVDAGDPVYQKFILEQAGRHNRLIPDAAGICIDRLDWLAQYNPKGDDGVSWVNGKPSRALYTSWQSLMDKLGPLMHRADKVIFINPINSKLDWLRQVDGIYTEFGQSGQSLNTSALMCLRKPVLAWTYNETLKQPNPDAFMQRHLYLGCFPTAPYPWNNHCINPEKEADQLYLDYGPLLNTLRGKKWVLAPHCVDTTTPEVKVNLFAVPGGYVLPVTFGGSNETTTVTVRNVPGLKKANCQAWQPGNESAQPVAAHFKEDALEMTVPLKRGCAMVVLRT